MKWRRRTSNKLLHASCKLNSIWFLDDSIWLPSCRQFGSLAGFLSAIILLGSSGCPSRCGLRAARAMDEATQLNYTNQFQQVSGAWAQFAIRLFALLGRLSQPAPSLRLEKEPIYLLFFFWCVGKSREQPTSSSQPVDKSLLSACVCCSAGHSRNTRDHRPVF